MRFGGFPLFLAVALAAQSVLAQTLGPNGQYVTSVALQRDDVPHTFWLKGYLPTASFQSLSVTASYNATNEVGETVSRTLVPYESTETYDSKGRVTGFYILLTERDWRSVPEEKTTLTFVCTVRGRYDAKSEYNNMFSLGHESGREHYPETVTEGSSPDNPYWITLQPEERFADCDSTNKYFSGTFYLCADLKAEHRYMFGIADADYPVTMHLRDSTNDLLRTAQAYTNEWADCGTNAWAVVPPVAGTYLFEVKSGRGKFRFKYAMTPDRSPAKHDHGVLTTSYPVTFEPGHFINPTNGFYDGVIDECLFAFSDYTARDRYVFRTTGATTNLMMRLYDAQGTVLATNYWTRCLDGTNLDYNVQLTWTADDLKASCSTSTCEACGCSGPIYVGVCQLLPEGETNLAENCCVTLSVTRVEGGMPNIPLTAMPDPVERSPFDMLTNVASRIKPIPSPDCLLNATNWSQVFVVQARAGITYRVKAGLVTNATHTAISSNGLALAVRAYTMSGSAKKDLPAGSVVGTEYFDPSATNWMEFAVADHKAVYLEVRVADGPWGSGRGLDYGPYRVCVTAETDKDHEYGVLQVDMLGAPDADMGWKILSGPVTAGIKASAEPYYPAGGSVILPPGGPYQIAARPISGFYRPDSRGYTSVYVENGGLVKAERYEYYDTFDPADDAWNTGAMISPTSGKPLLSSRSLWADDPGDWFVLSADEGAYYRFSLPWMSNGSNAEVRVFGPNMQIECAYNVYTNPTEAVRIVAAKGKYYVNVTHAAGQETVDGAYTLETLMMKPGVIKLAKNTIKVKETDGYANIVVNRTDRDGRIRVFYRTEPVAAVPGRDYYDQTGEFVWENGDASSRTVRVKLIPRMVTEKRGETRSFKVVFWTYDWEKDRDRIDPENEFIPAFDSRMGDTAFVTVTESGKVRHGTIRVAGTRTPKSPEFEVTAAGESGTTNLVVGFERVDGSFGTVGVHVEAVDGTAKAGIDYSFADTDLIWQDGERGVTNVTVAILRSADDVPAKQFKLKLTALRQYEKPSLASSKVSVTIRNDRFARTAAEFSKALPKTSGYSMRESRKGTWFMRPDGTWYGTGELTFSLVGPCLFRYSVGGGDPVEVRVAAGEKRNVVIPACDGLTYEYLFYDGRATELVQGVRYDAQVADASVYAVKAAPGGKLPPGLKIVREETNGTWHVRGIPTKEGNYYAQLLNDAKAVIGEVACAVSPIRSGAGSFVGLAKTTATRKGYPHLANHQHLAQVSLTASNKGKLSAKVLIAGKKYAFAADGYAGWTKTGDGTRELYAEMVQLQKVKRGGRKMEIANFLRCTVTDADTIDPATWYGKGGELSLEMVALPDAKGSGYQTNVVYAGELVRDNSKVKEWKTEISGYSAYYTVAFAPVVGDLHNPTNRHDGLPRGCGYLTMTVDAKGKVKYAGAVPDGTAYSGSAVAALGTIGGEPVVRLPLYASKGVGAFGGWVAVKFPAWGVPTGNIGETDAVLLPVVVQDGTNGVFWCTDDSSMDYTGQLGFELGYDPVGGWYDKVVNLQRYYLDRTNSVDRFAVDTASGTNLWLMSEALQTNLGETYGFVDMASPTNSAIDLSVNSLLVEGRVLAKDSTQSYNDWNNCANAANVQLKFKRATGVFSGTCDIWYQGLDATGMIDQGRFANCKCAGVWLLSRGESDALAWDVAAPGAVVVPQKVWHPGGYEFTWKSILWFNIREDGLAGSR